MKKFNNRGSGFVGILAVIVVLVAVGGAGAYVYHKHHKAKATTSNSTSSNSGSTGKSGTTQTPGPYAGWKTYTDATYHYSFKYPASDWTINTSSTSQVTLLNSDKSIEIDYINPYTHDNGPATLMTVSIDDLADATQGLKVVGGLYDGVTPEYNVVDSSLLSTEPLTVGQSSQFDGAPRFTDKSASYSGAFRVRSTVSGPQTSAWFSAPDTKTSLLILQSLTYQQ